MNQFLILSPNEHNGDISGDVSLYKLLFISLQNGKLMGSHDIAIKKILTSASLDFPILNNTHTETKACTENMMEYWYNCGFFSVCPHLLPPMYIRRLKRNSGRKVSERRGIFISVNRPYLNGRYARLATRGELNMNCQILELFYPVCLWYSSASYRPVLMKIFCVWPPAPRPPSDNNWTERRNSVRSYCVHQAHKFCQRKECLQGVGLHPHAVVISYFHNYHCRSCWDQAGEECWWCARAGVRGDGGDCGCGGQHEGGQDGGVHREQGGLSAHPEGTFFFLIWSICIYIYFFLDIKKNRVSV